MEFDYNSPKQKNPPSTGDGDSFSELFRNSDTNVQAEDLDYMDELLNNIGTAEQDGIYQSERLEDIEDNVEKEDDLSELLENSDNVSHGEKRDLTSPMSIDSGIELGQDRHSSYLPPHYLLNHPAPTPSPHSNHPSPSPSPYPHHSSHPSSTPSPNLTPPKNHFSENLEKEVDQEESDEEEIEAEVERKLEEEYDDNYEDFEESDDEMAEMDDDDSNAEDSSDSDEGPSSSKKTGPKIEIEWETETDSTTQTSHLNHPIPNLNPPDSIPNPTLPTCDSPSPSASNQVLESDQTSSKSPVSPSKTWKVEIIYNKQDKISYKEKEKSYWKKRKREDKDQPVKRKKVAWSCEEAPISMKKECPSSHYSYEDDDDFDDLYMFADMVGVKPGDTSDSSKESDTSDEESEEEDEPVSDKEEKLSPFPISSENTNAPSSHPVDDHNSHSPDFPYQHVDHYISLVPDYLQQFNSPSHHYTKQFNTSNTLEIASNTSPSASNTSPNQFCDPKLLRSPSKQEPSSTQPSSNVIVPEQGYEEEKKMKSTARSSMNLRPKHEADEVFIKPEVFDHPWPRVLTKRSRNRDRKVKLYEKGKMASAKEEERRLRALRAKLNRDKKKFEGIRTEERIKDLEKENEMLWEEVEERKRKEDEGVRRKVDLETALVESRKREKELEKMLEDAKKREEQLINEIREKQKREEELRVGEASSGKNGVSSQGLWTVAHPRSTITSVRLVLISPQSVRLVLIGLILVWIVKRRYWSNR